MTHKAPGPTARARASKRRKDLARQRAVAVELLPRDGACRFFGTFIDGTGECWGSSEPAHLGEKRRCHTRGMPPEERHDPIWEANLCTGHHRRYDHHEFDLEPVDAAVGANGQLNVLRDEKVIGTI